MKAKELIAVVEQSPSSIFSREDVIRLLQQVDQGASKAGLQQALASVGRLRQEVVTLDDINPNDVEVELSLSGMEIEIDYVRFGGLQDKQTDLEELVNQLEVQLQQLVGC